MLEVSKFIWEMVKVLTLSLLVLLLFNPAYKLQPHLTLSLNNLLLVPSITRNLISVSKFAKDDIVF